MTQLEAYVGIRDYLPQEGMRIVQVVSWGFLVQTVESWEYTADSIEREEAAPMRLPNLKDVVYRIGLLEHELRRREYGHFQTWVDRRICC